MEPYFDKTRNTGLTHLVNATRFSVRGLVAAFKRESAFRQELAVFVLLVPLGIWVASTPLEFATLMAVSIFVLVVELLNTAVEAAVDRISVEHHEMSGLAKDFGSAAVMLSLLAAGIVWLAFIIGRII